MEHATPTPPPVAKTEDDVKKKPEFVRTPHLTYSPFRNSDLAQLRGRLKKEKP